MNYFLILSGLFLFISMIICLANHAKAYQVSNPEGGNTQESNDFLVSWFMGRSISKMVSIDLLWTAFFLTLIGISLGPINYQFLFFIGILFLGYFFFWLFALYASKVKKGYYLKASQWSLLLAALLLIMVGLNQPL